MIKTTLSVYDFQNEWSKWEERKNTFSYFGKIALFEYLEQLSEEMGEDIELDIISLCCEYHEYTSAWDAMKEYQPEDMPTVDIVDENDNGKDLLEIGEESEALALEWLQDRTQVIPFSDEIFEDGKLVTKSGIIIQAF